MNENEFKLYKLLATEDNEYEIVLVDELGWVNNEFLVWVSYLWIKEFIESLKEIFGDSLTDDGGFDGNFQSDGVCLNLEEILDGYNIDLKTIFPIEKYKY